MGGASIIRVESTQIKYCVTNKLVTSQNEISQNLAKRRQPFLDVKAMVHVNKRMRMYTTQG